MSGDGEELATAIGALPYLRDLLADYREASAAADVAQRAFAEARERYNATTRTSDTGSAERVAAAGDYGAASASFSNAYDRESQAARRFAVAVARIVEGA